MRALLAVPRFFARLVRRLSRWLNPSADQRMRATLHKREARQKGYEALRDSYPRNRWPR